MGKTHTAPRRVSKSWSFETVDSLELGKFREILEADHSGLEKVKDRILEFLAVRKLTTQRKLPPKGFATSFRKH